MNGDITEKDFVHAITVGDRKALTTLYQLMMPVIRRLVSELGNGVEADAQDVFQDAVIIIYEKMKDPAFVLSSKFSTYFYSVCRNIRLTRIQKKSGNERSISNELLAEHPAFLHEMDILELDRRKLFEKAMLKIGIDCRKLLQLHFLKTPIPIIVQQLGFRSEGYARRRKHQCKERLIDMVKQDPAYIELLTNDR
ncbi:MAG: sigma-70 family RNA polymerase sigma factor [Saprospiraceae bacterium]|nr:sigma-70 family RNA polymerase sigma factor [Saprospiraceae bacterium]